MGNSSSKIIEIDNLEQHLSNCETLKTINSKIYGQLHFVRYDTMQFYLGQSKTGQEPQPYSLHYLIPPEILVVPEFILLEDVKPMSVDDLIEIMEGVSELCLKSIVGVARNRIAHAGRWGVVGQYYGDWQYNAIVQNPLNSGIYLSPNQMMSLSQNEDIANCDLSKADMFALGIILIEVIFGQSLTKIFDYENFQIILKPLLTKLNTIKQQFGDQIYNIFLQMLELEQQRRISFDELLILIDKYKNKSKNQYVIMNKPNPTYSNSNYQRQHSSTKSPLRRNPVQTYRNDVSPLRSGKFLERGKITQRNSNKSPIKRDLRINTRFQKQNNLKNYNGNSTTRSPNKPMVLRRGGVSPLSRR